MSDPLGYAYVNSGLPNPNFFGDLPRVIYSTGGAIDPIARMVLVDSAGAIAMSLSSGPRDGCPLIIKNIGAGTLTLTATVDGTAGTTSVDALGVLRLLWSAALGTWLSL
jgi:hypothetical protein